MIQTKNFDRDAIKKKTKINVTTIFQTKDQDEFKAFTGEGYSLRKAKK